MVLPWKRSGFLGHSTRELIFKAGSSTRMIGGLIPSCFDLEMPNGVPTRLTVSLPIMTLSFRFLTPSLLLLIAAVSMLWCRTGVERITGVALWWVSSWTIQVFTACSGRRTLIIPEWPSAYFSALLRDGPSRFKSFIREVFVLPAIKDLILEGPGQSQIYKTHPSVFHGCPKFRMLALHVHFG